MICKPCATGADMQTRADEITTKDAPVEGIDLSIYKFTQKLKKNGQTLHNFCMGKTHCNCQHKLVGAGNVQVS